VRRVLVLVIAAAAIAVSAGLAIPSSALTVNAGSLSQSQLSDELAAIAASPSYHCFLEAQAYLNGLNQPAPVHGVSVPSWFSTTAVEWANTRTRDLTIVPYVEQHDPSAFSPSNLAAARASLIVTIGVTIQAAYAQGSSRTGAFACTSFTAPPAGTNVGQLALASMPAWFQTEQVRANAAELGLEHLIPALLPTAGPALEAWYHGHSGTFATPCLSFIEVTNLAEAQLVAAKIAGGLSFAAAAKQYSKDPTTKNKGGALGCYSPSTPQWAAVQHYVGNVPTGHVSAPYPVPNSPAYLLFTVTKRTPNAFSAVHLAVASANGAVNRTHAALLAVQIQRAADVTVSPAIGTWQPTALGGTIVPTTQPPASSVTNATANAPIP
jgi:hypothetical protein